MMSVTAAPNNIFMEVLLNIKKKTKARKNTVPFSLMFATCF